MLTFIGTMDEHGPAATPVPGLAAKPCICSATPGARCRFSRFAPATGALTGCTVGTNTAGAAAGDAATGCAAGANTAGAAAGDAC